MAGGFDAGSIIAHVKADVSDFKKGIDEAHDKANNFSKGLDQMAGFGAKVASGIAVAGAGLAAFGALSVKSYMESENALQQLDAVLESTHHAAGVTADSAIQLSQSLQKVTKFSDETVLGAENLLLTFTNIGKDIFPQATETVLNMATALGEDTKDASVQLGKALQDPILGITALRRVGVNFTEDQKNVIQKLVETGHTAEAQKLILKELATEFGGSARAAGETFAGKLAILKNKFDDVKEGIGKTIVDGLLPLAQRLSDTMATQQFQDAMKKVAAAIVEVFLIVGKVIGILFELGTWLNHHRIIAAALAGIIGTSLVVAFTMWAIAAAQAAIATIAATWPILAIGAAIGAAAYLIITHWDAIKGAFQIAKDFIVRIIDDIKGYFHTIVGAISNALSGVWDAITAPFRKAFDWLHNQLDKVKGALNKLNPFAHFSPSLYELVSAGTDAIKGEYADMFKSIGDMTQQFTAASMAPAVAPQPAGSSVSTSIYGNINLGSNVDVDAFFNRLTRNQELVKKGITPQ